MIAPNSDEEWELEQQVFQAVGRSDVPADVQEMIKVLWREFVSREVWAEMLENSG